MAYEGIQVGNRVTNFSTSRADAVVVDQILNSTTLWAFFNRKGKAFNKPTVKKTVKITRTGLGESFIGLENLNSSAADTTIQMEWAHNAYTHPRVKVMLEHFANEGAGEDINLGNYIDQEAVHELSQDMGLQVYGTGAGNTILGLEALVDDGTNTTTNGGQTRTTYTVLNSTVTASGGAMTLAKLATLNDTVSDSGENQTSDLMVSTYTVWSLFEQLLTPTARHTYTLSVAGGVIRDSTETQQAMGGRAGFTAISYRGIPFIKDKQCTSGVLYMLNTNYLQWFGRTTVPADFKGYLTSVNLGSSSTLEAASAKPSDFHGWFSQKDQMMPNQAGILGRYYVIGQLVGFQPRRQGKLTGVTTVA